jgi:hypothetical protein
MMTTTTKLASDEATERAQKTLAAEKHLSDLSRAQYERKMRGKPTPTQHENDLAACGAHILEHEADGSDPDPNNQAIQGAEAKTMEAHKPAQAYRTKSAE